MSVLLHRSVELVIMDTSRSKESVLILHQPVESKDARPVLLSH